MFLVVGQYLFIMLDIFCQMMYKLYIKKETGSLRKITR